MPSDTICVQQLYWGTVLPERLVMNNRPIPHKLFGAASDSLKTSITGIRLLKQCLKP